MLWRFASRNDQRMLPSRRTTGTNRIRRRWEIQRVLKMSGIDGRECVRRHQLLLLQDRENRLRHKQFVFDELLDSTTNSPRSPT
jgi:hypothetical protein